MKHTAEQINEVKKCMSEAEQQFFDNLKGTTDVEKALHYYLKPQHDYLKPQRDFFRLSQTWIKRLNVLRKKHKIKGVDIAKTVGCSNDLISKIFKGKRYPKRDMLIAIGIAMQCPLDEICDLLRLCGYRELYLRNLRDAIIMHGIMHQNSLEEINTTLFNLGEDKILRRKT